MQCKVCNENIIAAAAKNPINIFKARKEGKSKT